VAAVAGTRLLETEGGDAGLRLVHELPESLLELHDVLLFGWRSPHSTPGLLAALWHASALAIPSPRTGASGWRRQRRSKGSSAAITSRPSRPATPMSPTGWRGSSRSRDRRLLLALPQETDAADQGGARRQERERSGLRHSDSRGGVGTSRIDEEDSERHQGDQQPRNVPIATYEEGTCAREATRQLRRQSLRVDRRAIAWPAAR